MCESTCVTGLEHRRPVSITLYHSAGAQVPNSLLRNAALHPKPGLRLDWIARRSKDIQQDCVVVLIVSITHHHPNSDEPSASIPKP